MVSMQLIIFLTTRISTFTWASYNPNPPIMTLSNRYAEENSKFRVTGNDFKPEDYGIRLLAFALAVDEAARALEEFDDIYYDEDQKMGFSQLKSQLLVSTTCTSL